MCRRRKPASKADYSGHACSPLLFLLSQVAGECPPYELAGKRRYLFDQVSGVGTCTEPLAPS